MKSWLFILLGIFLLVCGLVGGLGACIYCIAWGITDIIGMVNGDIEVTFWSVFWLVAMFFVREIIGAMVFFVFAGFSFMCFVASDW